MPTEEQIEVACDVAREELNAIEVMGISVGGHVTDKQIRDIFTKALIATENVLGGDEK